MEKEEVLAEVKPSGVEEVKYFPHRGISERAFKFFDVATKFIDKEPWEVRFPNPNGSALIRRYNLKSKMRIEGISKNAGLFGQNKFDPGGKVVTIVEGQYDVLAAWDMLQTPVVTPGSSSSAAKYCRDNWDYLNSFEKIVLCLDNDEPGEAASREIASLFDFNKVFIARLTVYKDANDYLEAGSSDDFIKCWRSAKKYTPDSVINTFADIKASLYSSTSKRLGTFPFEGLQNSLYGMFEGDVIVLKADEGIGKTETFRAIEHHLLKTEKEARLLLLHLEEDKSTTIKGIATYEDKQPYLHLDRDYDKEEIMRAYTSAVSGDDTRVFIYDSFDVEDEKTLFDNIRFLATICKVNFVFLDHITWLATGLEQDDERRRLDRISQRLKLLAKELGICIILISHTNDDGKTRGSRNISKAANTVIQMNRDKTSLVDTLRNTTFYTIEKARGGGTKTGSGGSAFYNSETLCLEDAEKAT